MISILVFDIETPDRTEMVVLAKTALSSVDICSVLVVTISDVVCDDVDTSRDDSDEITDGVDISLDVKSLRGVDVSDAVWDDLDDVDTSRDDSDEITDGVDISLDVKCLRGVDVSDTVWDDLDDVDTSRDDSDEITDGVDILVDDVVNSSDVT